MNGNFPIENRLLVLVYGQFATLKPFATADFKLNSMFSPQQMPWSMTQIILTHLIQYVTIVWSGRTWGLHLTASLLAKRSNTNTKLGKMLEKQFGNLNNGASIKEINRNKVKMWTGNRMSSLIPVRVESLRPIYLLNYTKNVVREWEQGMNRILQGFKMVPFVSDHRQYFDHLIRYENRANILLACSRQHKVSRELQNRKKSRACWECEVWFGFVMSKLLV